MTSGLYGLNMEFLQLRTLKAYRHSGSRSHTTVLDPWTLSVALQLRLSSPSSCDGDRLLPPSLETRIRTEYWMCSRGRQGPHVCTHLRYSRIW